MSHQKSSIEHRPSARPSSRQALVLADPAELRSGYTGVLPYCPVIADGCGDWDTAAARCFRKRCVFDTGDGWLQARRRSIEAAAHPDEHTFDPRALAAAVDAVIRHNRRIDDAAGGKE